MVGSSHRVRSLAISADVVDAYRLQTSKKQYAFHIYSWNNLDGLPQGGEETWEELYPTENLNILAYGTAYVSLSHVSQWVYSWVSDDRVQKAIKLTTNLVRTQWKVRPKIDDWVDSTGRIVLLGDAAHPSFVSTLFRTCILCTTLST